MLLFYQLGGQFYSRIGIEEEKLNDIVNDVGSDHDTVMNLGFALGFPKVFIDNYEALNNKSGKVSTAGTREMMFNWKRNTSPEKQLGKLREALIKAKLTEIADTHVPVSDGKVPVPLFNPWRVYADLMKRNLQTKVATLKTSETQTVGPNSSTARAESPELLCLKCDRVTAKITDVINTKRSDLAVHSKIRSIKGRECLMQLMTAHDAKTEELDGRYDVITLTTADVELGDNVFPWSDIDGYKEHRATRCKGCSEQVGWYDIPADSKSAPFYSLWLQRLIHDEYDSDNSLNAFYAKNRDEE